MVVLPEMYPYGAIGNPNRIEHPLLPSYAREVLSPLVQCLKEKDRPIVLDIGAGRGETSAFIQNAIPSARVISSDINFDAQNTLRQRHEMPQPLIASGEELPLPDSSIDCIHTKDSMNHFPNIEAFLAEAHRVLKPLGRIILVWAVTRSHFLRSVLGKIEHQPLESYEKYLQEASIIQELQQSGLPMTISAPFFMVSPQDVIDALGEKFILEKETTWQPQEEELELDWYKNRDQDTKKLLSTYRQVLWLSRKG